MDSPNSRLTDLWFAIRMPFLWRWRLGYWAWDSTLVAWRLVFAPRRKSMREWLVIEDSRTNGVFMNAAQLRPKGFIPRDVAERVLGKPHETRGERRWSPI